MSVRGMVIGEYEKGTKMAAVARLAGVSRQRVYQIVNGYHTNGNDIIKDELGISSCEECGNSERKLHLHHIDHDWTNDARSNLKVLCYVCHATAHVRGRKPFQLTCARCGKQFNNKYKVKYCSPSCLHIKAKPFEKPCPNCGKMFVVTRHGCKGEKMHCSKACSSKHMWARGAGWSDLPRSLAIRRNRPKKRMRTICVICNKPFIHDCSKKSEMHRKFCSMNCQMNRRWNTKVIPTPPHEIIYI